MERAIVRSSRYIKYTAYLPELLGWVAGLLALALMKPDEPHLFSLCPFSYVLEWCPGCGIGHAIAWLFRGEMGESWGAHPLGVPAIVLLFYRCLYLIRQHRMQVNLHSENH